MLEERAYFDVQFNKVVEHPKYYAHFLSDVVSVRMDRKRRSGDCVLMEHSVGSIACPLAHRISKRQYKFLSVVHFREHMRKFHGLYFQEYRCSLCDFKLALVKEIVDHMREKHGTYQCVCGRRFEVQMKFYQHIRECRSFFSRQPYEGYEKQFCNNTLCPICPDKQASTRDFLVHMLDTHQMKLRKLRCPICAEPCNDIEAFVTHMKQQHVMLKCTCQKQFNTHDAFENHTYRCRAHFESTGESILIE